MKKTLMVISKDPESIQNYFFGEFSVQVCENFSQAERMLLRYFEFQAQFSAVLVEEVNEEVRHFIEFLEKIEESCYLKTPVYLFGWFLRGI